MRLTEIYQIAENVWKLTEDLRPDIVQILNKDKSCKDLLQSGKAFGKICFCYRYPGNMTGNIHIINVYEDELEKILKDLEEYNQLLNTKVKEYVQIKYESFDLEKYNNHYMAGIGLGFCHITTNRLLKGQGGEALAF